MTKEERLHKWIFEFSTAGWREGQTPWQGGMWRHGDIWFLEVTTQWATTFSPV